MDACKMWHPMHAASTRLTLIKTLFCHARACPRALARRDWPTQQMSLIVLGVAVAACTVAGMAEWARRGTNGPFENGGYHAATVVELRLLMEVADLDLAAIRGERAGVPRLLLERLPADFHHIPTAGERRDLFIRAVLPLVLQVNEEILAERQLLKDMLRNSIGAGGADERLAEISDRYGADPSDPAELLRRVDKISPAVALAQAAEESGWGRSRFAQDGNALFGQRIWVKEGGLVPSGGPTESRFAVKTFPTLLESVRAYALNINSHAAYDSYRRQREAAGHQGQRPDPFGAAGTLVGYSERGAAYVQAIRAIMDDNSLADFELSEIR